MPSTIARRLALFLVVAAAAPSWGRAPRPVRLEAGVPARGVIRTDRDESSYRTYTLDVPAGAVAVRLRLTESAADLDLYLRHGSGMDDYSEADFFSETEAWREEMFLYKAYETYFPAGRYYLDVAYRLSDPPRRDGRTFVDVPYVLEFDVFDGRDTQSLAPGRAVDTILDDEGGYLAQFSLEVPRSADSFRIDVLDTPGDVDLFLSRSDPAPTRDSWDYIAESYLGRESVVVDGAAGTVSGTWYLTVLEASETEHPVPVRLSATLGSNPPDGVPALPDLPPAGDSLEALRAATVQLVGPYGIGSGCLVSANGHVLSNHHVVIDDGGDVLETMVVAVSSEAYRAPTEAFLAEVVDTSPEDDLALLRIVGDRWGRALPEGYRFPYWSLGDPDALDAGDPLLLMGYPWMGSGLSRSHFTLTRGILSGGESTPDGLVYKTDAVISGGSSGGAVSDDNGRLVGLPSFVVSDDAAQLTYFVPVNRLPRDWRRLFRYE